MCRVRGCRDQHISHFCKNCRNPDSDHFSSKCPQANNYPNYPNNPNYPNYPNNRQGNFNGYQGNGYQGNGYQGNGYQGNGYQGNGYQGNPISRSPHRSKQQMGFFDHLKDFLNEGPSSKGNKMPYNQNSRPMGCKAQGCNQQHSYHYCRNCQSRDSDHKSSRCPYKQNIKRTMKMQPVPNKSRNNQMDHQFNMKNHAPIVPNQTPQIIFHIQNSKRQRQHSRSSSSRSSIESIQKKPVNNYRDIKGQGVNDNDKYNGKKNKEMKGNGGYSSDEQSSKKV